MASWNGTPEPNVKVYEEIKRTSLQPAVGDNLIIAGVIVTNTGSTDPMLITSRSEFLSNYTPDGNITSEFIDQLNKLNEDAGMMFLNAYRLLGSAQMVLCRASGLNGVSYIKELSSNDSEYVLKDGEILKRRASVKFTITDLTQDWYINLNGIGIVGNGKLSDIPANTLNALAEKLNETNLFHIVDTPIVSEDGKSLELTNVFVSNNGILDKTNTQMPTGLTNITISPVEVDNAGTPITSFITNLNGSSGTLKVSLYKTSKDKSVTVTIDTNTETSTYVLGDDTDEGQITLDELNGYLEGLSITSTCPLYEITDIPERTTSNPTAQLTINVAIPDDSNMLVVGDRDYQLAWDKIADEERYVIEGVCDLGITKTLHQNYIATTAVAMNSFYPISPIRSNNYLQIANHFSKITTDNMNLYQICPWDIDDGSVGFAFNASPAVLYWEAVFRNRSLNNEFAATFGEINGIVSTVNLSKEFNRKERELLLTKRINTIFNDVAKDKIYINDCYTKQSTKDIMQEENNVRLKIHISKSMPGLLSQFRGRQSNERTWDEAATVIRTWFKKSILTKNYSIADYQVKCTADENPASVQNQNKMVVIVQVRYYNSVRYIEVVHQAYPIGIDFE